MLLRLSHQTDLNYSDLISESVMELRMAPRQEEDQHRLAFTLSIGPPAPALSYFDWLGNTVHAFTVNGFHKQIRIVATSVVETNRPRPDPLQLEDRWPLPTEELNYPTYDFLHFGGPVVDAPALYQLVETLGLKQGMPLGELTLQLVRMISEKFAYKKGVTNAFSPITDILEHGSGVCQDFTHLLLGMARALKIPARYVSGLVHPDAERYRGFTQTHAWCEVLFPSVGWIGFDAANNCVVGDNFVKVAVGRHFFDVPPNKGLFRGKAGEKIDVAVHSEELQTIPPELAAERVDSLPIPTYTGGVIASREIANQQQAQQ